MNLKKLELSGFKSFARPTVLEFPSRITSIVGPNGSGKSNIAEAIRWVLGEQSMKSLRGKKGEDLIWNGTPSFPKMGKASVTLVFDNRSKKIPLEFDEVVVSRKIFRDGLNEYYLNNSQVRLKEVVELMARIGLGETKHNIIGQGEVDKILMSSTRDRRGMLEEALGLRMYQLKKHEAERKFEATENNMKQVEVVLREITPHLKFLHSQAKKAEARGSIEMELRELEKIYFAKEKEEIEKEKISIASRREPHLDRQNALKAEIKKLQGQILEGEKLIAQSAFSYEDEKKVSRLESRRSELERELGRIEARIEMEKKEVSRPKLRTVDFRYVQDEIRAFIEEVKNIFETEESIDAIRPHVEVLLDDLEKLLRIIEKGSIEEKRTVETPPVIKGLEKTFQTFSQEMASIQKDLEALRAATKESREKFGLLQQKNRELDNTLRAIQEEEREIALALERFKFDEERFRERERMLFDEAGASGINLEDIRDISLDGYGEYSSEALRKKLERMRVKLEEIGGIDQVVLKEYQELEARHSFLTKELEDLKNASSALKTLIKELEEHIERDFKEGFKKIKEEFQKLFRIIFGGGKGSLEIIRVPLRGGQEEEEMESELVGGKEGVYEEGIEIAVDFPRKRVKGLAMLSGGERALTSIALLFAITLVNPPPFLVLDETDAALDEANSQRYAAILKELSQKTQLILVTHNRETMKCAGVLYGVAMGDDGVSKLLSIKLEEAEEYTNQ